MEENKELSALKNIMEKPRIFVHEGDNQFPYICNYSIEGVPYYVPPINKYPQKEFTLSEYLFLPISNDDFDNNKKDMFYGFRIFIANKDPYVVGMIGSPQTATAVLELKYEIRRLRYYPSGEKSIYIDQQKDPLFPSQSVEIKSPGEELNDRIIQAVNNIINTYCKYYLNNHI